MKNLDQNPAVLVSEARAELFAPIQDKLKALMSKPNSQLQVKFENNQNRKKNDGAIIQSGPFNISIRALLAANPLNGKIINETPFSVSIWRRQKFDLEKLQGFENYEFAGTQTANWKMLGNTFPTIFTEIIGKQILKML